jgi:hypothetical protein
MSRWYAVPTALIVLAITASASADWRVPARRISQQIRSTVSTTNSQPAVIEGDVYGGYIGMAPQGYPFYTGCCEPRLECCRDIWSGFCSEYRGLWRGHGCCGYGDSCGYGCGKGKGAAVSCGGKGGSCGGSCGYAAPSHGCGCHGSGLGFFGWRHFGHGCGYGYKGGCGAGYGKGKYAPATGSSAPMYDAPEVGAPTPDAPIPPPVSDQSADRRWSPLRFRGIN